MRSEIAEVETLGGLLMLQLDMVPSRGESAMVHGLKITAHVVDERHAHELLIERTGGR
jgi:CBS domain containing-hemolysin-like protein